MKPFVYFLALLCVPQCVFASDRTAGWAVIEKALKAAGGTEVLQKHQASRTTEKGKYYGLGNAIDYTSKTAVAHPGKFRMEIPNAFTLVCNGDQAWMHSNGATVELTGEKLKWQKEDRHAAWMATLIPLKDPAYGLEILGKVDADGRECVAVKVTHKDHRDVILDFAADDGLLQRMRTRTWSDELMKEVSQTVNLLDYTDRSGAKLPARLLVVRDGKTFVEMQVDEYEASDRLDDSLFGAP